MSTRTEPPKEVWQMTTDNTVTLSDVATYVYRGTCALVKTTHQGSLVEITLNDVLVHMVIVPSFSLSFDFEATVQTQIQNSKLQFKIQDVETNQECFECVWLIEYRKK